MAAAVGKSEEPSRDGSASSIATTPEPEAESYTAQEHPQQQQKRKGGRKPNCTVRAMSRPPLTKRRKIYATSEERKQRNRQAQAAFRERRTEYIKQLESTIKHHEETLQTLQQNHRSAADECLMLRYKNSLLERILLEKGIDVQAELRAKTGSPHLGPARVPPPGSAPQPPPMQRAIMNRHQQARRSYQGFPQKVEGVLGSPLAQPDGAVPNHSPHSQPTPASHISSPSTTATKSPNFIPTISPNIGPVSQSQQQPPLRPQPPPPRSQYNPLPGHRHSLSAQYPSTGGMSGASASSAAGNGLTGTANGGGPSSYYPSPFQSHMDQLGKLSRPILRALMHRAFTEQEYDAQADMIDDQDPSERSAGTGPYSQSFPPHIQPQTAPHLQAQGSGQLVPQQYQNGDSQYTSPAALQPADAHGNNAMYGNLNHGFDPYDPILDADPFGLSASMHFPTQFSYQAS
ncbi:uncharacterized protein K452DRAFT_310617 [Aplosporella prunicola CBS 121167]|uniref:BZIP domain-containing protein n=1 Tax=Aplosporella prunicola CBS 121167 TaxID=1176127 RepID=A0A6A6B747_9PEZI|nr:uncharacterized protein K452DRAFT_310617 [Aplosporella prunicola CBS 121167]KAF2139716.1 hypothetical protein K452DRAFT_310617 [Aplosporella prunicola CBS 121167]